MTENNCMCQEAGVLIFPCSGGSNMGELSDRVARKIARCGQANPVRNGISSHDISNGVKMFCLAGVGAHIPGMIESTKAANKVIAIDGCQVLCAKKTLEHAGFDPISFNLKDFGFEKGKTEVNDENIEKVASKISGGKIEKTIAHTSGGCCGN